MSDFSSGTEADTLSSWLGRHLLAGLYKFMLVSLLISTYWGTVLSQACDRRYLCLPVRSVRWLSSCHLTGEAVETQRGAHVTALEGEALLMEPPCVTLTSCLSLTPHTCHSENGLVSDETGVSERLCFFCFSALALRWGAAQERPSGAGWFFSPLLRGCRPAQSSVRVPAGLRLQQASHWGFCGNADSGSAAPTGSQFVMSSKLPSDVDAAGPCHTV